MRGTRILIVVLNVLLLNVLHPAAAASASDLGARVDRTQIAINESLTLTVTYQGQTLDEPDFSALNRDFDVLSSQRQSQLSFGGGANSSTTQWVLSLAPKRTGDLLIPSFHLQGEVSDALQVKVTKTAGKANTAQDVFVEVASDPPTPFTQQQVLLTYRFNTAVMLRDLNMNELQIPGAQVLKVGDSQYQKTIDGKTYTVVEIKYAVFPEQAGEIQIPSLRFTGVIPNLSDPFGGSFFSQRGKRVSVISEPVTLEVKPKPDTTGSGPWLPSQGLSLAQRWSREPNDLVVGEPITRNIIISAQGLQGAQLPPLNIEAQDGFKIYPDQPQIEDKLVQNGVLGTRIESVAIVPTTPGPVTLPPVTIHWWDTVSGKMRTTRLDAITLDVAAAPASATPPATIAGPPVTQIDATDSPPPMELSAKPASLLVWVLLATNFALLAALSVVIYLWRRSKSVYQQPQQITDKLTDEKKAFEQLKQARHQSATALREALLTWGRSFWYPLPIKTLEDVASKSASPTLRQYFHDLDAMIFGSNTADSNLDQALVDQILEELNMLRKGSPKNQQTPELEPLYPG